MSSELKSLTRRNFVKGTAAGIGTLAVGGWAVNNAQAAPIPQKWDMEADVVVAGFGGAGACAAIEAAKGGASVLLLEKSEAPGGSTRLSGGIVYAANTKLQKAAGLNDSIEAMYQYLMACGQGRAVPELVRTVADMSAENVEWLESMGAEFPVNLLSMSGMEALPEYVAITPPMKRGHRVKGGGFPLFDAMHRGVKAQKNIKVLLGTALTKPITRTTSANTNCEVIGVKAMRKGKEITIRAKKAVILATGGIMSGANEIAWLKDYSPDVALTVPAADLNATGDGYRFGMYCGGAMKGLNTAGYLPSALFPGEKMAGIVAANIWGLPNIYVSPEGKRFVDEGAYYTLVSEVMIAKRVTASYCIFDMNTVEKALALVPKGIVVTRTIAAGIDPRNLDEQVKKGILWKGNTVGELAQNLKMNPAVLEETLNVYNRNAAAGKDLEFGRTKALVGLKTPPYYAFKVSVGIVCHNGGLSINTKAQVLDTFNEVIPRLYAAGRDSIGIFGGRYPGSGGAVSDLITFGRIAGRVASSEKPWK